MIFFTDPEILIRILYLVVGFALGLFVGEIKESFSAKWR